jgi:aminopeptidase N
MLTWRRAVCAIRSVTMLRRATVLVLVIACLGMGCAGTSSGVRATPQRSTESVPPSNDPAPAETGSGGGPTPTQVATTSAAPADSSSPVPASSSVPPTATPTTCATIPVGTTPPVTVAPVTVDPSGAGIGDQLFPDLGNPGVDVQHYDLALTYDPSAKVLSGVVSATVTFTQALVAFNLDAAQSVKVSAVAIDNQPATFTHESRELRTTPAGPLDAGSTHVVTVTYRVDTLGRHIDGGLPSGWYDTGHGSYNLNEPDGGRLWMPSNDHPSDKATWSFTINVPTGTTAIANGELAAHQTDGSHDTWVWQETRPMSTYLVQVITGHYDLIDGTGPHGLALKSAVLSGDRAKMQPYLDSIGDQITFFENLFGPYPLDRYGIAMTDSSQGLAMEDQERSLFSSADFDGSTGLLPQLLLSHELAHQWFGDAVSPARWQDVWLNESFATYGQWLWLDHVGLISLDKSVANAADMLRDEPTTHPTAEGLFGQAVYDGGAFALHALRRQIGDSTFFSLLQHWVATNNGTSRTTEDFINFAQAVSGQNLGDFFARYLDTVDVPKVLPC